MERIVETTWLPEYPGLEPLISTSQQVTFAFWIVASTAFEILSNYSALAEWEVSNENPFLRRPDYYCIDASFETA